MADSRFFKSAGPFSLERLAEIAGATLSDPAAGAVLVDDIAPLETATQTQLSFLDNKKYVDAFRQSKAKACLVRAELVDQAPDGMVCLITQNPYKSYALVAQAFYPEAKSNGTIAPSAVIDASAVIGDGTSVGACAVIGRDVTIGKNCVIMPGAVIADGVEIGDETHIGANTSLMCCKIGDRVRIYPGACIGQAGFGFAIDQTGFITVPQLGRVIIEDDVEVGANTTIDRGAGPDTIIGRGTRIDNLVQIGHNVRTGENCVIVAQTGISGSTHLGDFVMTGGQSGFAGHIKVGSGARVAAQSGVMRDIAPGNEVMGCPAVPIKQFMRQTAVLSKLTRPTNKKKEADK